MDPIPDHWPPEGDAIDEPDGPVVPMFPLPGVFLFPRQLMPLHVFEERYRQMVEDCLDGPGRIVMGTILEGQDERAASPTVATIAGLGEIARHDRTPDGRYLIWLFGLGRVRLAEVGTDRMYRKVRVAPVDEVEPQADDVDRLRERLYAAVLDRSEDQLNLPEGLPAGLVTDLLSQRLTVPQSLMEQIFAELDVTRRAALALDAHSRYPPNET